MPSGDRNRLLYDDFQCVRQFASGILCRRLGPHNPPALDREPLSQPVEGTVRPLPAAVQPMRVDHRRIDVLVPQQFLHRPDVVTVLQTPVKADEAATPVDVGLLGPAAVMPSAQDIHQAVVEPRSRLAREQPQRQATTRGFTTPWPPPKTGGEIVRDA